MRCHYISDLHLERQAFAAKLPAGDVLIVAGDLAEARCLDPAARDRYNTEQRDRVMRFVDEAVSKFAHVLMIAGNHEHFQGVLEDSAALLRRHLPGVTVLDNETVVIGGVRFFGATLWTDFGGGDPARMQAVRRRVGEFFFIKTRGGGAGGGECRGDGALVKFQPEHALAAHRTSRAALAREAGRDDGRPLVVVTHHAPSHLGLNPRFAGNGLDPAYASALDADIAGFANVPFWVHGHTHVVCRYAIGRTEVRSNAYGVRGRGNATPGFSPKANFEVG